MRMITLGLTACITACAGAQLPRSAEQPAVDSDRGAQPSDPAIPVQPAVSSPTKVATATSRSRVSYGEEDEAIFVKSRYESSKRFSVGTAFSNRIFDPDQPLDDSRGYWQMKINAVPLGSRATLDAEFAQSSFDPRTSEGFGDTENRLVKLASSSAWQGFTFGAGYQSVGKNFRKDARGAHGSDSQDNPVNKTREGEEGSEAWVSRQFGKLGVKTFASVYRDNLEDDNTAPRFTSRKIGGALNYMIASWPSVGITVDYGSGTRSSSAEPAGIRPMQVDVETIATSLYYAGNYWDGTLYVGNELGAGGTNVASLRTYWAGGSWYPFSTFTVSPSISMVEEDYAELNAKTNSFAAAMSASYKPFENSPYSFTAYSEYSTEKNLAWSMDSEYVYSSLGIDWESNKRGSWLKTWSMELFHDRYVDNLYSGNNTGGPGLMLTVRSSGASRRHFIDDLH